MSYSRGRFGWIVVGHIPKELSRYVWYSIQEGAKYVEVYKKKPMASPLLQGGLEIPIKVSVTWDCLEKLSILVAKLKDVQYPITGEYIDSSKDILHDLGVENDEESDDGGSDGDDSGYEIDDIDFEKDKVDKDKHNDEA